MEEIIQYQVCGACGHSQYWHISDDGSCHFEQNEKQCDCKIFSSITIKQKVNKMEEIPNTQGAPASNMQAQGQGHKGDHMRKISAEQLQEIKALRQGGTTIPELAKRYGVTDSAIWQRLNHYSSYHYKRKPMGKHVSHKYAPRTRSFSKYGKTLAKFSTKGIPKGSPEWIIAKKAYSAARTKLLSKRKGGLHKVAHYNLDMSLYSTKGLDPKSPEAIERKHNYYLATKSIKKHRESSRQAYLRKKAREGMPSPRTLTLHKKGERLTKEFLEELRRLHDSGISYDTLSHSHNVSFGALSLHLRKARNSEVPRPRGRPLASSHPYALPRKIIEYRAQGMTYGEISGKLNVSYTTISRVLTKEARRTQGSRVPQVTHLSTLEEMSPIGWGKGSEDDNEEAKDLSILNPLLQERCFKTTPETERAIRRLMIACVDLPKLVNKLIVEFTEEQFPDFKDQIKKRDRQNLKYNRYRQFPSEDEGV